MNKFLAFAFLRSAVRAPVAVKPVPAPIALTEKQMAHVAGGILPVAGW